MKTVQFQKFLGINNKLPPTSLNTEEGRWLADALNVDVDNDGSILRRIGTERVASVTAPHSLFQDMLVRAGVLYRYALPYAETMLRLLSTNDRMSYAKIGAQVFMSNGTDWLRINCNGDVVPWALPAPDAPTVEPVAGEMSPGEYAVSIAYANCEEIGCASEASVVSAVAPLAGGVRVTLPSGVEGATHIKVYVSGNGGNVPMLHSTVEVGTPSVDIVTAPTGAEASRQIEAPLPAGSRIFEYNGRLCSVKGKALYIGQPYRHGYYLPLSGVIPFHDDISVAVGNQDGIYVAAGGKTYFIAGQDIESGETMVRDVFNFGAVPGTEFVHPEKPLVGWFSHEGLVVAAPSGEAKVLMESVSVSPPASGVSLVLTNDRRDRVVSCGYCVNLGTGATTRYDGFNFTSYNATHGTKADGLYVIGADVAVDASIDLGNENFGVEQEKRMPAIYLGASSEQPLVVTVGAVGGTAYDYPARSSSETLDVHRVDPGKGLRGNWFNIVIENNGDEFKLASVSFAPVASNRRI